jgi:hypothetical protein
MGQDPILVCWYSISAAYPRGAGGLKHPHFQFAISYYINNTKVFISKLTKMCQIKHYIRGCKFVKKTSACKLNSTEKKRFKKN